MDISLHPCFNCQAKVKFGRVHLPVAPECNIQCNYCDTKYFCVNENRPGAATKIYTPDECIDYLKTYLPAHDFVKVIGVAGPRDPFGRPMETIKTLELVRNHFPDKLLCLATNGLNVLPYIDRLNELEVSHISITLNAIDPKISRKIYKWIKCDGKKYTGSEAAELLLERQTAAIKKLKETAIIIKVNTVVIPGINEHHIVDVARYLAALKVDIMNCMPFYPVATSHFKGIKETTPEFMNKLRRETGKYIPQMGHCTRCRADAAGLLGDAV